MPIPLPRGLAARLLVAAALVSMLAISFGPALLPTIGGSQAGASSAPQGIDKIKHIVFLVKENRSFDQMFGTFPGAAGTRTGVLSSGKVVPLATGRDRLPTDVAHDYYAATLGANHGKMNRFDQIPGAYAPDGTPQSLSEQTYQTIPNYWAYASHFTLADHFFSTVVGPSYPNHFFT